MKLLRKDLLNQLFFLKNNKDSLSYNTLPFKDKNELNCLHRLLISAVLHRRKSCVCYLATIMKQERWLISFVLQYKQYYKSKKEAAIIIRSLKFAIDFAAWKEQLF